MKSQILLLSFLIFFISSCQIDLPSSQTIKPGGIHTVVFSEAPATELGSNIELRLTITAKADIKNAFVNIIFPKELTLVKGNTREPIESLTLGETIEYTYLFSPTQEGRFVILAFVVEPLEGGQEVTAAETTLPVGDSQEIITPEGKRPIGCRVEGELCIDELKRA